MAITTGLPTQDHTITNHTVTKHPLTDKDDAMGNHSTTAANHTTTNHTAIDQPIVGEHIQEELLDFDPEFGLGFPAEQRDALAAMYGTGVVKRLAPRDRKLSDQMKTLPE